MTRSIMMTGVDGSVWDLCNGDVLAGTDPALWGTAPAVVTEEARLGVAGSTVTAVRHTSRDMVIPLRIRGDIERNISALARATDPTRGDALITVGRPDGTTREIDARMIGGLSLIPMRSHVATFATAAMSLRAMRPYWRSTEAVAVTIDPPGNVWDSGAATPYDANISYDTMLPYTGARVGEIAYDEPIGYDAPIPYDGAAAETLVLDFNLDADVDAWPRWTVQGPCSAVSAANLSTGEAWRLPDGLLTGEQLVVLTQPGDRSVRVNGSLALPRMTDGARLWGLRPGRNTVSIQFAGRSDQSTLSVSWDREWLTC